MVHQNFKVAVRCATYNHSKFIINTMEGFVAQETNFPFVCCIIDDASTDGEQSVIVRYLQDNFDLSNSKIARIEQKDFAYFYFAQHLENKNCFFAVWLLKENHYRKKNKWKYASEWLDSCKYIAFCEGDDFWICEKKLQKQVDFLDSHPAYVMCTHDFLEYIQETERYRDLSRYERYQIPFEFLEGESRFDYDIEHYATNRWLYQPLSWIYRRGDYLKKIPISKYTFFRDTVLVYYLLKEGKGTLFQDKMGVYRIHSGGIFSGHSSFQNEMVAFTNYWQLYLNEKDERLIEVCNNRLYSALFLATNYKELKAISGWWFDFFIKAPFQYKFLSMRYFRHRWSIFIRSLVRDNL